MSIQHGAGWLPLHAVVATQLPPGAGIAGGKEKYGALRLELRGANLLTHEQFAELLHWARAESLATCKTCGNPGSLCRWDFHVRTRCDECDDAAAGSSPWM